MKAIAIDIDSSRVIIYATELLTDRSISNITGEFKSITIKDDYDNSEIREFQSTIHSFFNNINPARIGILKRMTKGKFAASPISFKLEGLIQCYSNCEVEFIPPQTLAAFYKNNEFIIDPPNKYQMDAARLAQYLIS